jgi:hypothetical protein
MFREREISARKLVRIEGQSFEGWGCSQCSWVFKPSGPPLGYSLESMKRNFQAQLSNEFASHDCAGQPRGKALAKVNGMP